MNHLYKMTTYKELYKSDITEVVNQQKKAYFKDYKAGGI
jgi:hypothetical protein